MKGGVRMSKREVFSSNKVKNLKLNLPTNLRKFLTKKQILLLKCISANATIQEMVKVTEYTRKDIIFHLMNLGRNLATYDMIENKCFPDNVHSADYLQGWNDLKHQIKMNSRSVVNDKKYWR